MPTAGLTTIGANEITHNTPVGTQQFIDEGDGSGTLTKLTFYARSISSSDVRVAVFANTGGAPDAKLAESVSAVTVTTVGWYELTIPDVVINPDDEFWLCFFASNSDARFYYDTGYVAQANLDTGSYPTWPDPWTEDANFAREYSIYATFGEEEEIVVPVGTAVF